MLPNVLSSQLRPPQAASFFPLRQVSSCGRVDLVVWFQRLGARQFVHELVRKLALPFVFGFFHSSSKWPCNFLKALPLECGCQSPD